MIGTTMPTPVYSLYQVEFGFSVFVVTIIFAAYSLGVLTALLAFGRWSDSLGRRPMLLAGIAFGIVSASVFIFAGSLTALLIGRVLSGLSAEATSTFFVVLYIAISVPVIGAGAAANA